MKQLTIIFAAAVIFLTASSFTASVPSPSENENVIAVFKKDFSNASEVTWKEKGGFYFVSFVNDGDRRQAAYDEDGNLIATSQFLYSNALPLEVIDALTARFPKAMIGSHASKLTYEGGDSYYVSVSTDKKIMNVVVTPDLSVTVERRIKLRENK
jgi:hypothetical protein